MKKALISVSDKTGIVEFAKELINLDYEILSTGGTKRLLEENNIAVTKVSDYTKSPEILDGRVKTLHPMIHGGLLALRNNPSHLEAMKENNIDFIDLVCVNLYPFVETINKEGTTFDEAIEQIDIGGPTMIRSAAKNYKYVTTITDNDDFIRVVKEIKEHGETSLELKKELSLKAFLKTAVYDSYISNYLINELVYNPKTFTKVFELDNQLRYGENPHQEASLYKMDNDDYSLLNAEILNGKQLSYNNIQDANVAINILKEFKEPTAVALKHMNPCGIGSSNNILDAFNLAYNSDPVSIFGGIISLNQKVTKALALELNKIFLEIIIAPSYDDDALVELKTKKNLRVLKLDTTKSSSTTKQIVTVNGGALIQDVDQLELTKSMITTATTLTPTDNEIEEMIFAMKACKHVKSNAIVITKGTATVGVGAGQMNRVGAALIALNWAKEHGHNEELTLASDAFFPFDDVVKLASKYGVTKIIQPGGSIRDKDSIKACNELGIKMVFTGNRHFKH
ncbi:bifunctional phosphoribosylaminoimidazolecarboxamide formyltransferase/IMP cyclohydrolase [Candidatus Izimaplasma bacterium ZiA1]|uniref:bifunctional phosphoribosylaminoimidazolecarboxamide formyltransferase/IMP cyclohydrolase n=1 Tax=Candidatus Izimoplasma sp. ZiA1 TaxID=2024899 RepID=UPI000BAA445E|nr:bifunctional phosphoribosylaminoimidazolecarboxamide formyltransferase/IMP cyclohydrolase [Candidatus Izimaplasma bacterium ZiA1]